MCGFLCCFFFQAEDGIRDWSVTGVQTWCSSDLATVDLSWASPLSDVREPGPARSSRPPGPPGAPKSKTGRVGAPTQPVRSEERRVGKECRSLWSPYR